MKFSCPSCAAKYQIADDKVAGRTVKMKCRKCGATIPIRAGPSAKSVAAAPTVRASSLGPRKDAPAPPSIPAARPIAEWHAGIGGSPVGPMTLAAVEAKVASGEVTSETFLWKEGMDGWKPLPDIAELAGLLEAAGPPSMPAPAKAQGLGARAPAPAAPAPAPAAPAPRAAAPPAPAAIVEPRPGAKTTEQALAGAGVAPRIDEAPAPIPSLQSPPNEGPVSVGPTDDGLTGRGGAPVGVAPEDVAPAGVAAGAAPEAQPAEAPIPPISTPGEGTEGPYVANQEHHHSYDSLVAQLQRKRHNPLAIPLAVVAALVLGVTVGFVLFGDQKTKIIRQVVEVPAQMKESTEHRRQVQDSADQAAVAAAASKEDKTESPSSEGTASQSGTSKSKGPSAKTEDAAPSAPANSGALKGLAGLDGLGGPSAGPSTPSGSTGGSQLSESQIQRTVRTYQSSVKRGCWQQALMARDANAPSTARVTVSISVAPSGRVTSASAPGGDPRGYSGLSSCITSRVRGWSFPRSGGSTTVNVPFVFAAQ